MKSKKDARCGLAVVEETEAGRLELLSVGSMPESAKALSLTGFDNEALGPPTGADFGGATDEATLEGAEVPSGLLKRDAVDAFRRLPGRNAPTVGGASSWTGMKCFG